MFIPRKKFTNSGPEFSEIMYGTERLLEDPKGYYYGRILEKLNVCLETGITTFAIPQFSQTESSEMVIGNVLRQEKSLRNKIEIISKCKLSFSEFGNLSNESTILRSVENSLENLGVEKIDLLLVEIPDFHLKNGNLLKAIQELLKDGKILQFGISNPNSSNIFSIQSFELPIATFEFVFNPIRQDAIKNGLFDACMQLKIKPIISYPFEFGYLFSSKTQQLQKLKTILNSISKEKHASLEELLLSWITKHLSSPFVIINALKDERIILLRDYKNIQLSEREWDEIFRVGEIN